MTSERVCRRGSNAESSLRSRLRNGSQRESNGIAIVVSPGTHLLLSFVPSIQISAPVHFISRDSREFLGREHLKKNEHAYDDKFEVLSTSLLPFLLPLPPLLSPCFSAASSSLVLPPPPQLRLP